MVVENKGTGGSMIYGTKLAGDSYFHRCSLAQTRLGSTQKCISSSITIKFSRPKVIYTTDRKHHSVKQQTSNCSIELRQTAEIPSFRLFFIFKTERQLLKNSNYYPYLRPVYCSREMEAKCHVQLNAPMKLWRRRK